MQLRELSELGIRGGGAPTSLLCPGPLGWFLGGYVGWGPFLGKQRWSQRTRSREMILHIQPIRLACVCVCVCVLGVGGECVCESVHACVLGSADTAVWAGVNRAFAAAMVKLRPGAQGRRPEPSSRS